MDDLHTLVVEATDGCGNTGNKSIGFRVDTTPPEVSITSPTDGSTIYTSTIIVTGIVSDTGSGPGTTADVKLDGITIQTASIFGGDFTAVFNTLPDGIHTLIATVRDNCGNTANSATVKVFINEIDCPDSIDPSGVVDDLGSVGRDTSLEFNYCSLPRISYYDIGNGDLKYAEWDGLYWNTQTVDSAENVGQHTSLALDKNGYPRISYYDVGNGDLRYAVWDGSGWCIQTVDSVGNVGYYTSLKLDANNNPKISYLDLSNVDLKYAEWSPGGGWNIQTVDSTGDVGFDTSLALNNNGYPKISYYNGGTNGDLKYASWTGTNWNIEIVDDTGRVGRYTSLALDNNGYPKISYIENFTNGDLKYASWTGTNWNIQIVDNNEYSKYYSSLAIDSSNSPRISYYINIVADLMYATYNGSSWVVNPVDTSGSVGHYCSLAIDNDDNTGISYFDASNNNLKFIYIPINAPVITSLNPTVGQTNEVITINGYSFGSTQGSSTVNFGGITASIVSWSDTTIEAQVPVGLSSGVVLVKVTVNGKSSLGKLFTVICVDSDQPTWDTTIGVQYVEVWGECVCVDCFPPEAVASVYWNGASDNCEPVGYNIYYNDGFNYYESLGHACGENFQPYDCLGCIDVYSGSSYWVTVRAIDSSNPPNEDTNSENFFFSVP